MKKKYVWLTAAIVYCMAIFITTASPVSTGGNTLMILAELLHLSEEQARIANLVFRKLVHLSAFGLLAILFYNSFEKRRFLQAWLYTTLYAASDEIHQAFLPDRTGSIVDVGIDSVGALIALVIVKMAVSRRRKPNKVLNK
ncbi:VanZ family protein [Cytobacillus depressus]|uniref:VanZ family protein n=1 Tax=Cytobacillus depressus TaxID=1602942 RepID=A0A6L3UX14_9BACI|nr:VanZ family protein [Cytobacillus depressus]KAB2328492.1 VanZ family protein [Cytobacillus depressus]